jgi:hypothetical protein
VDLREPQGRKDQVEEFEKYRDMPGFIGVKAHPFWHHFTPVELAPVAERLARTGRPPHPCRVREEGNFEALLKKVPDLKLILAHAGFPYYGDTWKTITSHKNVFLDLSQTAYTSERAARKAADMLGPERLLFGTDGPTGFHGPDHQYDYGFLKRMIERVFKDARDRKGSWAETSPALRALTETGRTSGALKQIVRPHETVPMIKAGHRGSPSGADTGHLSSQEDTFRFSGHPLPGIVLPFAGNSSIFSLAWRLLIYSGTVSPGPDNTAIFHMRRLQGCSNLMTMLTNARSKTGRGSGA